jgi:hypothetical protein
MGGLAKSGAGLVCGRPTRWARRGPVTLLSPCRSYASILTRVFAAAAPLLLAFAIALYPSPGVAGPTPEEYVAHVGGDAKIVPPGELKLDGYRLVCGQRPTVLDNNLDDYGAAYPGFLILNPKLLAKVAPPVKLWIHAHECGHQFRGPDEETADCFAVQRGRRQRWLTPEGLEEVCRFIAPAKGDSMHFSGSHRCEAMRACYTDPEIK